MTRRLRRIPRPLALLLAIATIQSVAWMVVLPPFQGGDEDSHFSYSQRIVENHTIPWRPGGGPTLPFDQRFSKEIQVAELQTGLGPLKQNLEARPPFSPIDVGLWRRADVALTSADRGSGGYLASLRNPPAYYVYAAVPYAVGKGGSIFDRLMLMRLWNIPLLLFALVFVWLVIGELVGRGWPQVLGTAAASFIPQLMNVVSGVTPDIAIVAVWCAALYVMLLVLRRGPTLRLVGLLAALCVLGGLTHSRSLPLFLPAALAVLIAVARERGWSAVTPLRATLAAGGGYVIVLLAISGVGHGSVREFVSYLWQFYLPKLGFMTPMIGPAHYGFRQAYVDRLYSNFAWLEVELPSGVQSWLFWASVVALVALVAVLIRHRQAVRARSAEAFVLLTAIVGLLLGLHIGAYRALIWDKGDPIVTARYLLPLLPLFGAAIALIVTSLPRRAAGVVAGLILAVGVGLQFEALGLLLERFYA